MSAKRSSVSEATGLRRWRRRTGMERLLALAAIPITACGPAPKAPAAPDLHPSKVTGGDCVDLVMACTPTGPELCFNAVDDNCNGVIDEGCGMATGPLQFTVAWGDSPA